MPDFIREALNERGLMDAYSARPPYQQNDYIGSLCVTRAWQEPTKQNDWLKCWVNSKAGAFT